VACPRPALPNASHTTCNARALGSRKAVGNAITAHAGSQEQRSHMRRGLHPVPEDMCVRSTLNRPSPALIADRMHQFSRTRAPRRLSRSATRSAERREWMPRSRTSLSCSALRFNAAARAPRAPFCVLQRSFGRGAARCCCCCCCSLLYQTSSVICVNNQAIRHMRGG
jgi:hypothetical protein